MSEAQVTDQETEQDVPSVGDSIREAVESLRESDPAPEPEPEEEPDSPEADEDPGEEPEPAPDEEPDPSDNPDEPEPEEVVLAPASWSKADREAWDKLPDETKAVIARRESERDKTLYQVTRDAGPLRAVVEENRDFFRQRQIAPDEGIRVLIDTAKQLHYGTPSQKLEVLHQIARNYNVPLEQAASPAQTAEKDEYADPDLVALEQRLGGRVAELESEIESRRLAESSVKKQTADNLAGAFFQELEKTDPKEAPEVRYMDNAQVWPIFNAMVVAEQQSGRALDVSDLRNLFSQAAWAVPDVRDGMLRDTAALKSAKPKAEAKPRTVRRTVKRVASSTSGGGGSVPHSDDLPEKENVRDTIRRSMAELAGD